MSRIGPILIVSQQAAEVQSIIQPHQPETVVEVVTLDDVWQRLETATRSSWALLIIDLDRLNIFHNSGTSASLPDLIKDIPILILAPLPQRHRAIEYLVHPHVDYLLTPLDRTELLLKVERILALAPFPPDKVPPATSIELLLHLNLAIQAIRPTLEMDEALSKVLHHACQVTQAEQARIYLTNRAGDLSQISHITTPAAAAWTDAEIFSLAQRAALSQQMTLPSPPSPSLVIPMISRDKLIGVLALRNSRPAPFSKEYTQWLAVFCDQAAIAIENARLFQDLSSVYIDLAQSREKILHSRNTLRVVFDGITDGLYILNNDLTISALNRIEAERQGCAPQDLIGKQYTSLTWAESAPDLLEKIYEAIERGQDTVWISAKDEPEPYLKDREFRIYPIRNRLAQIEQVMIFAQDVSERRRWQASLFRSANLAAVGQLAGSVAHQINNPLTVTMTNSQLILLDALPNSEAADLAEGIFKAGERIQNIVTNLLEFSNQERYFFVQTDLVESIEGALELVIRSMKKAKIEVVKAYESRPYLAASVSHLKLVWINLLLNARDAVLEGVDQPQITIATRSVSEREVAITISDNGAGITPKDFEQLFRPFFTTKPVGKALGLGLYSAHAIVERHNGQIKASSPPGEVTAFEVILPLDNPRDL